MNLICSSPMVVSALHVNHRVMLPGWFDPRILEKVNNLYKSLEGLGDKLSEEYQAGIVDGWSTELGSWKALLMFDHTYQLFSLWKPWAGSSCKHYQERSRVEDLGGESQERVWALGFLHNRISAIWCYVLRILEAFQLEQRARTGLMIIIL